MLLHKAMTFRIKDFLNKFESFFIEESLNEKFQFLCSVSYKSIKKTGDFIMWPKLYCRCGHVTKV